jgi:ParB-like chromosome segregation protein Spo0J
MTLSFAPEAIETWPLSKLQPYSKNAKAHGADQVAKIASSMAEFGWTVPCLVADDGELIAGHGRVLAATQLGLTEAPVIVLGHLTEAQRRAYRIADNKLTELGTWDETLLSAELNDLLAEDYDLSLIGFDDAELEALLAGEVDPETASREGEDDVPDAPETPVSRPGRSLGAGQASAALRRQHGGHGRRASARRCDTAADGHRSALWRRVRSGLAQPGGRGQRPSAPARC